ncbi:MAG: DUF5371 family protein [Euryarchaeota archaeon]|jgi:hypothetical protein|nr:MAG: hypothetical protein C5S47_05830 [ANME-2 cluster archaeon]MEA1865618.1 DUF5371 family protein [Euryarchaeota archaeon]
MTKIVHVQTVLTDDDLAALKQKSGHKTTKDAVATAVEHYLECPYTETGDMWAERLKKTIDDRRK